MANVIMVIKVYKDGRSYEGATVSIDRTPIDEESAKYTSNEGEVFFEVEEGGQVAVYVDGNCSFSGYLYEFTKGYKHEKGLIVRL